MKHQNYDLIGDIHGQHDKLTALLNALGYLPRGHFAGWTHSEGRKVIFLGDYIDRGPKSREVLMEVRGMVDSGDALAIMGNHEYNAILYQMPDGAGDYLRPRVAKNVRQHAATLAAFASRDEEWARWIAWMKRLPMFLDLVRLRVVHACWDAGRIAWLGRQEMGSEAFFRKSAEPRSRAHRAVENVLKGPELSLPDGVVYHDKEGVARNRIRARWWNLPVGASPAGLLALPEPFEADGTIPGYEIRRIPNYGADEAPVFFGHYWMPPHRPMAPLAPNLACLDFSAGLGGTPLVAYRWDGEQVLGEAHFFRAEG